MHNTFPSCIYQHCALPPHTKSQLIVFRTASCRSHRRPNFTVTAATPFTMVHTIDSIFLNMSAIGGYVEKPSTLDNKKVTSDEFDTFIDELIAEQDAIYSLDSSQFSDMKSAITDYFDGTLTDERKKLKEEEDAADAAGIVSGACDVASVFLDAVPVIGFCLSAAAIAGLATQLSLEDEISKLENTIISDLCNADTNIRSEYSTAFSVYNTYGDNKNACITMIKRLYVGGDSGDAHESALGVVVSVKKFNDGTATRDEVKSAFQDIYNADSDDSVSGYVNDVLSIHSKLYDIAEAGENMPSAATIESALLSKMVDLPDGIINSLCRLNIGLGSFMVVKFYRAYGGISAAWRAIRNATAQTVTTAIEDDVPNTKLLCTLDATGAKDATTAEVDLGTASLSTEENNVIRSLETTEEAAEIEGAAAKVVKVFSVCMKGLVFAGGVATIVISILDLVNSSDYDDKLKEQIESSKNQLITYYRAVLSADSDNIPDLPMTTTNTVEKVLAFDADTWAESVIGQFTWASVTGSFDETNGCMTSETVDGVSTIICGQTDTYAVITTIYLCVGGSGAEFVALDVYPNLTFFNYNSSTDSWDKVTDWTTSKLSTTSDGNTYYWYKSDVLWYNIDSDSPATGYFKATTARAESSTDQAKSFYIWAYYADNTELTLPPTAPFSDSTKLVEGDDSAGWGGAILKQDVSSTDLDWTQSFEYLPSWSLAMPYGYGDTKKIQLDGTIASAATFTSYICTSYPCTVKYGVGESDGFSTTYTYTSYAPWVGVYDATSNPDGTETGWGDTDATALACELRYWYKLEYTFDDSMVGTLVELVVEDADDYDFTMWAFTG
eukprot:TRINITY_DN5830_c0_g1_i1.p1 TRINITY_DN5830_c0_g1~~TRINITY_DN5830_c0_g1_i1.p1  ORF type:complete len:838 (+),score=114.30 TRINITY_DN5830_c0_g1_i1:6902-9415(+)